MAHAMLNETPQVARIKARLKNEFPGFTPEVFISTYPVTNPVAIAAIRQGARRAGLASCPRTIPLIRTKRRAPNSRRRPLR